MPLPVIVAGTYTPSNNIGGTVLTVPVSKAGANAGDTLVICVRAQSNGVTGIAFSDGVIRQTPWQPSDANFRTTIIATKYCATLADIPASVTFTVTGTSGRFAATSMLVRGVDATQPVDASFPTVGGGGSSATKTTSMPAFTATTNGLAIAITANEVVAPNIATPTAVAAGWTALGQSATPGDTTTTRTVIDTYTAPVTGGTTLAFGNTHATAGGLAAAMLVLKPAAAAPPAVTGMTVSYHNGTTTQQGNLYVTNGAGEQTPVLDILALNQTPMTVSKWLTKRPMYSAHRGGSKNWPEHTMRAYTNAVWHGATMLEASMHCTSDGVFVLSHDATLTTTTAPSTIIKNNTWDQIKGLTQQGLPLMRLEELLDSYAKTHLLMLDDKSGANMTQLLAKLKAAFPNDYLERFLIKTYGAGGLSQLGLATAQGYRSWIFFYSDATNGDQTQLADFTTRAAQATLIGLNWDAPQASWDRAIATGKPVLAHIPDAAAKAQAGIDKGAAGIQAADVLGIIPKINTIP